MVFFFHDDGDMHQVMLMMVRAFTGRLKQMQSCGQLLLLPGLPTEGLEYRRCGYEACRNAKLESG